MTKSEINTFDFSKIKVLSKGYAHNALPNPNQFWDAFLAGYTFLEADVHLVDNQLIVSHDPPTLKEQEHTLEKVYLDPLFALFQKHQRHSLPQFQSPFQLMIDIKTDAKATYLQLLKILKPYHEMFTQWEGDEQKDGVVTVIVSGKKPLEMIAKETNRLVCVDGRLKDLGKGYSSQLMPIISDRFTKICWWQLVGLNYSKREIRLLRQCVQQVHAEGKQIRFWRTPENERTWQLLMEVGVDWIGTDKNLQLANFL